jgi:hypothetical protein
MNNCCSAVDGRVTVAIHEKSVRDPTDCWALFRPVDVRCYSTLLHFDGTTPEQQ